MPLGHLTPRLVEKGSVLMTLTPPAACGLTERDSELASKLELAA